MSIIYHKVIHDFKTYAVITDYSFWFLSLGEFLIYGILAKHVSPCTGSICFFSILVNMALLRFAGPWFRPWACCPNNTLASHAAGCKYVHCRWGIQ